MGDLEELKFKVDCKLGKFIMNLKDGTCSCQAWVLTSILYQHSIFIMCWKNRLLEDFVHPYLKKEIVVKVYTPLI